MRRALLLELSKAEGSRRKCGDSGKYSSKLRRVSARGVITKNQLIQRIYEPWENV